MTTNPINDVIRKFSFEVNAEVWQKSDNNGKDRRIGGICTTDDIDQQSEILLQEGLDFGPFLKNGWFNDNHDASMEAVLGYPTNAELRSEGLRKGWYVEGYFVKGSPRADAVWMLANALQKTDRRLGFSVEGAVTSRDDANPKVVRKAVIRNVAITHVPVNTSTTLSVLAKSLAAGEAVPLPRSEPQTGENGRLLSPQSIEAQKSAKKIRKRKKLSDLEERVLVKAERGEPLNRNDAIKLLMMMAPTLPEREAARIVDYDLRRKAG